MTEDEIQAEAIADHISRAKHPRASRVYLRAAAIALSDAEGPIVTAMELYRLADEWALLCSPQAYKPGDLV